MTAATDTTSAVRDSRARPAWIEPPPLSLRVARAVTLTAVVLMVVFPFATVLGTSLASDRDVINAGGYLLIPEHPTLAAFRSVLRNGVVVRAMTVSICVTVVGTLLSLAVTTAMAYGLSQPRTKFRPIVYMVLFTMLFTPGIIPNYLIVRQLGLLDSYAALILPVAVNAFNLIVMRQFFMTIPTELMDAARVDGAGEVRILLSIVLPLAKPVMAVVGLFYAVAYWNAFFGAMLYLSDNSGWPLQMIVRMYVLQGSNVESLTSEVGALAPQPQQMAVVVCATIPILIVYPMLQRYFTSGVLSGAIKG